MSLLDSERPRDVGALADDHITRRTPADLAAAHGHGGHCRALIALDETFTGGFSRNSRRNVFPCSPLQGR